MSTSAPSSSSLGSSSSVSLTPSAYLKLVLHSAKYSSRGVLGLLVASSAPASAQATVIVDDVLPLFHTTPLSAAIEVALSQAEASLPASSTLVGVYYAGEAFEPRTTNGNLALPMPQANIAIKIAEKIRENGKGAAGSRILLVSESRWAREQQQQQHQHPRADSCSPALPRCSLCVPVGLCPAWRSRRARFRGDPLGSGLVRAGRRQARMDLDRRSQDRRQRTDTDRQ